MTVTVTVTATVTVTVTATRTDEQRADAHDTHATDTIKSRIQSREGFVKAGGFKNIYKGLGPAALGSFPGAALFFVTYEETKAGLIRSGATTPLTAHAVAASAGEVVACLVRVPIEGLKQNLQVNRFDSMGAAVRSFAQKGGWFNGYFSTVLRDVPFSLVQFPLWEAGKSAVARAQGSECTPLESAALGSFSGAFSAAITTPLDVCKTRLMTSPEKYHGVVSTLRTIVDEEGARALLKGIEPRVFWIGIGGFVYFGAYESAKKAVRWFSSH